MLGLCMIVKNEEHVIERALRSALPNMDTWCIVDTGSSDKTKEIIQNIANEYNIKGYLYDRPWVNFGHNRSEALALAKGHMTWAFMLDADDNIEGTIDKNILLNEVPGYNIIINLGNITFNRVHLFNLSYEWSYVGSLHEYPTNKSGAPVNLLINNLIIIARTEGSRSSDPKKYLNDALFLEKEIIDSKNKNARNLFYLAQSYRDAGIKDKAIQYYLERTNVVGWNEEIYMSYYNLINLSDTYEDKLKYAWKAQNIIPERREAVYEVISWARKNNIFTHEVYTLGLSVEGQFDGTHLFTNPYMYGWSFYDEFGIIAYFTQHYKLAHMLFTTALESCPESEKTRIQTNIDFSLKYMEPEIIEVTI